MSQTVLSLDFETFSRANLKKVGTGRYTRDPSSRALLLGYAIDDEPVNVLELSRGQQMPKRLKEALRDPDVIKSAWNAAFERQVFQNILHMPIPFEQWRCTMVMAYTLSFPGELSVVGRLLGVPEDKQKIAYGKKLIKRFCGPNKPTKKNPWEICDDLTHPAEWAEFVEYCGRDVESERFIRNKILKWDMPDHEWELYHLDQRINEAGIPINMNMVENAIRIADTTVSARLAEMRRITGLANPNSNVQLLGWLKEQGYKFDDLKKGHVQTAINRLYEACQDDPGAYEYHRELIRVLEMRQEVSKTSVKKYVALREAVDDDGVLRNALQFAGAQRTWRWGGRRFQPQNLARPTPRLEKVLEEVAHHVETLDADTIELLHKYPMDVLSSCVRPVVQAQDGFIFVDADLNAIENRVLGWLANDQKILDVFRKGRDPYIDFATYMFKESYEVLFHEYDVEGKKERRTLSKPAVLGCGFMLSAGEERLNQKTGEIEGTGLIGYARNMGVNMTRDQAVHAVKVFRNTFTEVVKFWYNLERAAKACIRTGRPQRVGFIVFDMSGPFMRMKLPSGRSIHYFKPRVELKRKPWGDIGETITYEGLNDKNQWVRVPTHPGKLTENAVQAVARDLLGHAMLLCRKRKLGIRLHVHDQIVGMVKKENVELGMQILVDSMKTVPKWAPGLLLDAKGAPARVFMKD